MTSPHWLAGGATTWTPNVVVFFDTETTETADGDDLVHRLRCWDALVVHRHGVYPQRGRTLYRRGEVLAELVDQVEATSLTDSEVWVMAHNLNFDLAVTQLPAILAERGWHVAAWGLQKESNWWVLRQPGRRLVIVDSWSWVSAPLEQVARDMRRRKVPLPGPDDDLETWHKRCRRDVEILSAAMCSIMDWWDDQRLGRFAITGAGCGWSAMRTRTGARKLVVGADPPRTAFEREAIYGGRKEIFHVGEIHGEWVADYDFVTAYPTVAAHHKVPVAAKESFSVLPSNIEPGADGRYDVIARCLVTTDIPCAPCRLGHDVWWPVGRFHTVLTGPEIRFAQTHAQSVDVGPGQTYRMDYALRDWAVWCLALLASPAGETPAVVRRMAKGWSRSVLGRFAGHRSQVIANRPSFGPGWRLEPGHDLDTGRPIDVLHIGGRELTVAHELDGMDCSPAVLAFVEGWCRADVGRMLATRDPRRLLQVNTDGWWERRVVRSASYDLPRVPWPHAVVRKACVNEVVLLGPDHLTMPGARRLAGVATQATGDVASGYVWHDWPGLRWQLERAAQGTYTRPRRALELKASYARRWVLEGGETVPVATDVDPAGQTVILGWNETPGRREDDRLAPYQDEALEPLRGPASLTPVILGGLGRADLPGRSTSRYLVDRAQALRGREAGGRRLQRLRRRSAGR